LVTYLLAMHPRAELVGDPMVGCGTVAVEATAAGKPGLYSDVDPLACLLTRAKCRPVNPAWLVGMVQTVIENSKPLAKPGTKRSKATKAIKDLEGSTVFRAPPNVFHWFQPYVAYNLSNILREIGNIETNSRRRDALLAIVASVIRRVSRADPSTASGLEVTGVRRKELSAGLRFDVAAELLAKARQMANGYRELRATGHVGRALVVEQDARHWSKVCQKNSMTPDLVITSPCYMSAIEYWRRHRLEYSWLGLVAPSDLPYMRRRFLGMGKEDPDLQGLPRGVLEAHDELRKRGYPREATALARYFDDSAKWLDELATTLRKSNGIAYVVCGPNTSRGIRVDTPELLAEIARAIGLSSEVFLRYRITNCHMQYPTKGDRRIRFEAVLRLTTS